MRDWEAFVRSRVSLSGRPPALRDRVIRELTEQLQDACEDGCLRGMSAPEAEAFALAQVGDWQAFAAELEIATSANAEPRLQRAGSRLDTLRERYSGWRAVATGAGGDLVLALRGLRAEPGFTAVALTVLALGIGAATAIFSVVDGVVLRSLPFDEPDRIASVLEVDPKRAETFGSGRTTAPTFLEWRRLQTSFEALAAVGSVDFRSHSPAGDPTEARGCAVSWEFLRVLRAAPPIGRAFRPDDEVQGNQRVVLLGHAFWQRQYGGAADVVGRTIELNEEPWRIVGVMPLGFAYPPAADRPADLYVPLSFDQVERSRDSGHAYSYSVIGRLKPGVTLEQARERMARLAAILDKEYPTWSRGRTTRVVTLQEHLVGRARPWMMMLLCAVGLVLLIACANVANLMLARATTRSRDAAIRAALGARRWHLLRAPLVEGLVLASGGSAAGVALAYAGVRVLRAWLPFGLPRVAAIAIDYRVLGTAVAAALLTGLVFGLAPGIQALRQDASGLAADGRSAVTGSAAGRRVRSVLVVSEVALAALLLVGAGLFGRSFANVMQIDPGFDCERVLALRVGLRVNGRQLTDQMMERSRAYVSRVLDAVGRVPGVQAAATVSGGLPLSGAWNRSSVELPGRGELLGDGDDIDVHTVSPGYLKVMRIPLLRGRYLSADDREASQPVAVVSQTAARKYWPGQEALGQHITIRDKDRVVVGIVGDTHHLGPETPPRQEAYLPAAQTPAFGATLVVRTTRPPLDVLPSVKSAIWAINPEQRFGSEAVTLDAYMERLIGQRRFTMALTALLGLLALVIAAAGVYGVMGYLVAQRTSEIGVRMALGATPASVLSMVVRGGAVLLLSGLTVGCAGAWFLRSGVQAFLFDVRADDPWVFAGALGVLALAGLLACAIPARRAALVDPLAALRHD